MAKTYAEKLKDPRWQRKRLEIMQRDGFACRHCGDEKTTLHVHHWEYNGEPWEANDGDLATLCEICHDFAESVITHVKPLGELGEFFKKVLRCTLFSSNDNGYVPMDDIGCVVFLKAIHKTNTHLVMREIAARLIDKAEKLESES